MRVSIGDRLSSFSGVIQENAWLPEARVGELVAVLSAGAYTGSAAQRFMFGLPEVILLDRTLSTIAAADRPDILARPDQRRG